VDEPLQREHLLVQARHIFLHTGLSGLAPKSVLKARDLPTDPHRYYGVAAQYPLLLLEFFPGRFNPKEPLFWQLRHLYTRIIFLLSALAFFFLIRRITQSGWVLFSGVMLYMLHPRIHANSFYNIKDLLFLPFMVFSMLLLVRFTEKATWRRAAWLGVVSALAINIRMMGVLVPLFVALWLLVRVRSDAKGAVGLGLAYLGAAALTLLLVWPTLWTNPLRLLGEAFTHFSNYSVWNGTVVFKGTLIKGSELPATYIPVWIGITSPFAHLLAWVLGILVFAYQRGAAFFRREGGGQVAGVFSIYVVLASYLAILFFRSTLYGDWRHLYYLFPMLCVLAVYALEEFRRFSKWMFIAILFVLAASLAQTAWWMVKNHPYQNVYFNFLAGREWGKKWDRDNWHLSTRQAFLRLLAKDGTRRTISVYRTRKENSLPRSVWMLPKNLQARIKFVRDPKLADVAVGGYRNVMGDYPHDSFKDMKEYLSIAVDGNKIVTVFKRADND
jgi:hypothetical protein